MHEELAEILSAFARTMATDAPIHKILDQLVDRTAEVMPISGAEVTLFDGDTAAPGPVAASGAAPMRMELLQASWVDGPGDVAAAYILNIRARQDLKEATDRYRARALHDALTGLPNRVLFGELLEHALLRTRRSGQNLAVLFADLDRFKEVNDALGHHVGDEVLVAVTRRLRELLRPDDTLVRLGGDEFVGLCEGLHEISDGEAGRWGSSPGARPPGTPGAW